MPHASKQKRSCALWSCLLLMAACALALLPAAPVAADDSLPQPAGQDAAADSPPTGITLLEEEAATAGPSAVVVPGLRAPNGLAIHGVTRQVYVTSRDNNTLFRLDPADLRVLNQAAVGSLPWGVAVDPHANRVYVANFGSASVSVLNSADLTRVATIAMGARAQPTFIALLSRLNRAFVANHGANTIAVVNTLNNTVEKFVKPGDTGAWGLAANANLNRVYVSFRESATLVTLDGASGWAALPGQTIRPCGNPPDGSPYALAFNTANNKLYVACAVSGIVKNVVIYAATRTGLIQLRRNNVASFEATAAAAGSLGAISGAHLTLIGDADMEVFDAAGRRAGPGTGWTGGYRNSIPGATFEAVQRAQVAALARAGDYTVVLRGQPAGTAARLNVNSLQSGAMAQTIAFSGLPITTTTVATLTLHVPVVAPELSLAYRYTPDSPLQVVAGTVVGGRAAADVMSPRAAVAIDPASGLVQVSADDGEGGSGVAQVLVGAGTNGDYREYTGPFAWPDGAACIAAVAIDRTGNSGAARLCRTWMPMLAQ